MLYLFPHKWGFPQIVINCLLVERQSKVNFTLNKTNFESTQKPPAIKFLLSLVLLGAIRLVIWNIPFGQLILCPCSILGICFHKMRHGLMTVSLGGTFSYLEIFMSGSGLAYSFYPDKFG